jgi:uncharacterized repeat protein (TIGR01451 family)
VTVTVTNLNDPPVAQDDAFTVLASTSNNPLNVLADNGNGPDSDPDGDPLTIVAVGPTDNGGTVVIDGNGTPFDPADDFLSYTPAVGFFGTETFTYTIDDGNGETDVATVTMTVNADAVTSLVAEVFPNNALPGVVAQPFLYDLLPEINPGNSGVQAVEINAPAGYTNLIVSGVEVDGAGLVRNCPSPGINEYCESITLNVMTITLGSKVTTNQTNIRVLFTADTPTASGSGDFTSSAYDGPLPKVAAQPGNADGDPMDQNSMTVVVGQTQGQILQLTKSANKREVLVGGVVSYLIEIRNPTPQPVLTVEIADAIPPNFKFVDGSARLDGAPIGDPSGNRPLVFDVGTVPGFVDGDSDNIVDPGEPGYLALTYQLVVGSGATPGSYPNVAVARDVCDTCFVSNEATTAVEVGLDPVFDLGTIIGKVYEDRNRNAWQDRDEPGVANAMVALDDGTYALTDEFGRFHFPAVEPGHRMLKINLHSLPPGTEAATEKSHIAWITPGLMVKVNFGVVLRQDSETIGESAVRGLALVTDHDERPVEVRGSADALSVLVNGNEVTLPTGDVRLRFGELDENVRIVGGRLEHPVTFALEVDRPDEVESWTLSILNGRGDVLRSLQNDGPAPEATTWDGFTEDKHLVSAGEIYQYQLEVRYRDGSRVNSPRRLFGVNRAGILSLDLLGEAFETNEAVLSAKARDVLREAGTLLRRYPDEKVVIEGHTDSVGPDAYNVGLSRRRAQSAANYLIDELGLPAAQFTVLGFGESRPVATNATDVGRALNRRVEVKGEVEFDEEAAVLDWHRVAPAVRIDGEPVGTGRFGRFRTDLGDADGSVEIELSDAQGRYVKAAVPLPEIDITAPAGRFVIAYGETARDCVAADPATRPGPAVTCRMAGRTQPGNTVEVDGHSTPVGEDGSFVSDVELRLGSNLYGVVVRNPDGFTRMANLGIDVTDRSASGDLLLVSEGVPSLTVKLPPRGVRLTAPLWNFAGLTDPGNRVTVNEQDVEVAADGRFKGSVQLPHGKSQLLVQTTSPDGRVGTIEREVDVAKHNLFLLAFADGKFGKTEADGFIEGAGVDDDDDYYTEGRLAFYLKGHISGKYLITAAFDSGRDELDQLFQDLDGEATNRLLTNLDPDKFYPVYGDGSTVVYDAESDGKLYLALESDEMNLVVGNYALSLDDTELAAYRRTLYGGNFSYQSVSRTEYGDPDTEVAVFVSDIRQAHVRDELRATGGSIYYLSQRDVVEGSEEVTLLVRDKNTGLVISREPQRRNVDYIFKHEEGRLMFQRPISSVAESGSIVNQEILHGHPVFIHVDYETILNSLEKTGSGGRVRRQIGDHVAVGGTYIQDELASGSYDLTAFDAEVRLGQGTRFTAEYADSEGNDSRMFVSEDGGLSYTEVAANGVEEGSAWKATAELDVGEWFGQPDRFQVDLYYKELEPGFFSSGNFLEQGTDKMGVHANLNVTDRDKIQLRHDREERTGGGVTPAQTGDTTIDSVQWFRTHDRWGVAAEYFSSELDDDATGSDERSGLGAMQFWIKPTDKLKARLEHQETFTGDSNDQTRLGLEYQALPSLALELEGTDGRVGHSARAGAIFTHGESKIYLSERLDESRIGTKRTTVVGSKAPIGPSSRVYTEYQWEDSETGADRALSLLGAQRQWETEKGLKLLLSGEVADIDSGGDTSRRSAVSSSISYARSEDLKVLSRQEVRFEDGTTDRVQYFTVNQFDYRVKPSATVLARYRYSKTRDRDSDTIESRFEERTVGVAFRPVDHDRFNSLAKYTRLLDQRPLNVGGGDPTRTTMDVVSLETAFDLNRRVEWLTKEAFRLQREEADGLPAVETESLLTIQRFNVNLWKPIDLGAEYRILTERESSDQRQGWLSELTWKLMENFRVGAGYNFTDFSDDEFSQNDYSVKGWFFRVQGRY